MSSITFVTAFINIYDETFDNKDTKWRYKNFELLAKSGINICLYTNDDCYNDLSEIITKYPNVKMMRIFNLEDTIAYNSCESVEISLPNNRNNKKDTSKYMILINSKIEFLNDAVIENPWNSTHFSWIDFSIFYIFNNVDTITEYLSILSRRIFSPNILLFPGCWNKLNKDCIDKVLNSIYWRFCGGFFLGDADYITKFYELYKKHFKNFLTEHKKLIWEVNFWAWLESNTDWRPDWYNGDHNDSIFYIPTKYYARYLNYNLEKTTYYYPAIENFFPSNASYLFHSGKHILNTRFINYSYGSSGGYLINHPKDTIVTKNIMAILDDDLLPVSYNEMDESNIGLESHDSYSMGLEDIRLYSYKDTIKYIATNVNYVGNRANRMIIGEYDIINNTYINSKLIQPPIPTPCEKNWIPIVKNEEEYFIYKWSPFQIGKISPETNRLEIIETHEVNSPDFNRIRGSSIFIPFTEESIIGVVHFCEETIPRQYYHMLVTLDKTTLKPLTYSDPFCFQHFGVEFCIGFTIKDGKYVFWVSKKDNDTIMVSIDSIAIPLNRIVKN